MDPQEQQGLGAQGGGAPAGPPDLMSSMQQQLQGSTAMLDKLEGGQKILARARQSLDHLTSLGDNVSPQDVVDMGGALVGAGLSPSAVAQLLAQMPPEGGTGLAGWVKQQEQGLAQREQMHQQAHAAMQHHVGVNAMRLLAGHHLGQQPGGGPELAQPQPQPAGLGLQ